MRLPGGAPDGANEMKNIKLILRKDVENLGATGDVVTVKQGFARNYLLPRGDAFEATAGNVRRLEEEQRRGEARAKRDYLEAKRRASQLESISLTFKANAGEESKLFGSITSGDIHEQLQEQSLDFEIERRQIMLEEPIKALGVYSVPIRLHGEVRPEIKVWVIKAD
jgi:large subunit ribosomal protein L9